MNQTRKPRIGDLLVAARQISPVQLQEALAEQKRSGRKLGQVLVDSGMIAEAAMLTALSEQLQIPFLQLSQYPFNAATVRLIPEVKARRFRAIALECDEAGVLVGMSDPTNPFAIDELSRVLTQPMRLCVVSESDLASALDVAYGPG